MIAYLNGRIVAAKIGVIIVKAPSGVGYWVYVSSKKNYMVNENVDLFIYTAYKESAPELFGFDTLDERDWCEKLLKINGVGAKTAANLVYQIGIGRMLEAISNQDSKVFSDNVKGLGIKTAKKIILELKGKDTDMQKLNDGIGKFSNSSFAGEFTDTLSGLGYTRGEVVSAISRLKKENLWHEDDLVETVRNGLRALGRG